MGENTLLKNSPFGIIKTNAVKNIKAWEIVCDVVDYPVWITPVYFYDEDDGDYSNCDGKTKTGRGKEFRAVIVDKYRDGTKDTISIVTDTYGALDTVATYKDFHKQLDQMNIEYDVNGVFVSGDGGYHELDVTINSLESCVGGDDFRMLLRLTTSVDGTKAHSISVVCKDVVNNVSLFVAGANFKLKARHTCTISERTIHFIPTIKLMVKEWNDTIVPTMLMMAEQKFDRELAFELLEDICDSAKIGERHKERIKQLYVTDAVRTSVKGESLHRVNVTLNQYIDDNMGDKRDLQTRFKGGIAKAIKREFQKLKKK